VCSPDVGVEGWQLSHVSGAVEVHAGDCLFPRTAVEPWQYTSQLPPAPAYAGFVTFFRAVVLNSTSALPSRWASDAGKVWAGTA
jgi:hypothetical protein